MRISTSAFRAAARGGSRRPLARPATTAVRERALHTSASLASGGNQQHHFTADNQDDETFDFTAQSYERVHTILAKYPNNYKQSGMIPLLDLAQRQVKEQTGRSFLPLSAMNKVAQILGVMPMRVYEVATFYTMFHRERVGRFFIQLCGTTPCMACGAQKIKSTISEHLGIGDGETTDDGLFTLLEVECLGACSNAPMIQLNDDFYENLTAETTVELLEYCKEHGEAPPLTKWGSLPLNGQLSCEGPQGKSTLLAGPLNTAEPNMRDDLEPKVDPASVARHMHYL